MILNGTQYNLPGYARVKIDGRLTCTFNGTERCAWIGGPDGPRRDFSRELLTEYAESLTDTYWVLNVEHFGPDETGKLIDILETVRFANPNLQIGVWSILPKSAYTVVANYAAYADFRSGRPHDARGMGWWAQPSNGPTIVAAYRGWQTDNALTAAKLRPHIDFTCPSIYPVYEPPRDKPWMGAREPELMIAACRPLCPRLPCLPCWQPNLPGGGPRISDTYANTVMSAAMAKADGFMVWTDVFVPESEAAQSLDMATKFATSEE